MADTPRTFKDRDGASWMVLSLDDSDATPTAVRLADIRQVTKAGDGSLVYCRDAQSGHIELREVLDPWTAITRTMEAP